MERLKLKWGLKSSLQVLLVLLTFSLAGSSVVVLRKWYFGALGFDEHTAFWIKALAYVVFMFPAYQLLILAYGSLLGQFRFFWEKEKKLALLLARPFRG
jgi:hypothetical protein